MADLEKFVRLNCLNQKTGSILPIDFELTGSDFSFRWFEAVRRDVAAGKPIFEGAGFLGAIFYSQDEIITEMNQCIDHVNSYKNKTWIPRRAFKEMSHPYLMQIHDDFERLVPHPEFAYISKDRSYTKSLMRLNDLIHKYEQFYLEMKDSFHIDLNFVHPGRYDLEFEDYNLFSADWKWGRLYVAYGTTGVPTSNGASVEDQQTPLAQYYYTSGMYVNFEEDGQPIEYNTVNENLIKNYGKTLTNPYASFGLLHVGDFIPTMSREELVEKIVDHARVSSVETVMPWKERYFGFMSRPKVKPYLPTLVTPERVRKKPSCGEIQEYLFVDSDRRIKLTLVNENQETLDLYYRVYNNLNSHCWEDFIYKNISRTTTDEILLKTGYCGKKQFEFELKNKMRIKKKDKTYLDCLSPWALWGEILLTLNEEGDTFQKVVLNFCPDKVPVPTESNRKRIQSWGLAPVELEDCETLYALALLQEDDGLTRRKVIDFVDGSVQVKALEVVNIKDAPQAKFNPTLPEREATL